MRQEQILDPLCYNGSKHQPLPVQLKTLEIVLPMRSGYMNLKRCLHLLLLIWLPEVSEAQDLRFWEMSLLVRFGQEMILLRSLPERFLRPLPGLSIIMSIS